MHALVDAMRLRFDDGSPNVLGWLTGSGTRIYGARIRPVNRISGLPTLREEMVDKWTQVNSCHNF